ncbi:MAG: HD-GYP domain-containing protein [Gammaproteobacteria bacterium]|nr:HD-GYP domain-containing protein [Gammaproteobacteria bacterium]
MLKKIKVSQVKPGMYVHDLDCGWLEHPFFRSRFTVSDESVVEKIVVTEIQHLVIDTEKGIDCEEESVCDVQSTLQQNISDNHARKEGDGKQVPAADEIDNARHIYQEATGVIHHLYEEVRLGKQVVLEHIEPITEKIVNSVFRNKDALISLTRIKDKDQYTFKHSVSVSGLLASFALDRGFSRERIRQVVLGGLLHDVGKMQVPAEILNKPEKLTDSEYEIMKSHVIHGMGLLTELPGLTQDAMDVVTMHHERIDGSGYPRGLKGNEIPMVGQMSMIVDVYDALTSVRCYKNAWEPSYTLKKMLEWCGRQFNQELVSHYIRCLGIYPVGSLVQLKSGLVGIVMEQNEKDLLRPDVRVIYNSRFEKYVQVKDIQMRKLPEETIVEAISPEKYNIDLAAFV